MRIGRPALALAGIVAVAALTRFIRLDLMEFKRDEAEACRLALHALGFSQPGVGRFFPTAGLQASVGVPNPPLFIYLVAIPLAIVRSPLAVVTAIAAANVVAVALCYVAGRRIFSPFVGFVSAALFALSPWSIVFSRKIWAQDLLPLVTTLFLLELHALVVERKERAVATLPLLAAVGLQLHFSAIVLVVVAAAALLVARDVIRVRLLGGSLVVCALLYLPFLIAHGGSLGHASSGATPPTLVHRFMNNAHLMAEIHGADGLGGLMGSQTALAQPIALLLAVLALGGLLLAWRMSRGSRRVVHGLVCGWYLLPAALLTMYPTYGYIHYYIVILPLPFFGLARAAELVVGRRPAVAAVCVGAALAYFAAVDVGLFRTVVHDGGAPGDYGVAYRFTAAAVRDVRALSRGRSITVAGDYRMATYRTLLWIQDVSRGTGTKSPTAYRFVSLLGDPHASRAGLVAREGPLLVIGEDGR